jgi:hypothetical protein
VGWAVAARPRDHFIPWSRHPDNGIENLVVTDRRCNCEDLALKLATVELNGQDPLRFVLAKNDHRRHLTTSQRALVAARLDDGLAI